jgi:MYXO-CTERM domain-containing protein
MRKVPALIAAVALAALAPAAGLAQGPGTVDTSYGNPQEEEDDGFPWGLLGLLGLAGLIPRKRHERVDVDNRTRS